MSLHDRIMALDFRPHRDPYATRDKAVKIAKQSDELMAEMAAVLESASVGAVVIDSAKDVLDKYNDWEDGVK